MATRGLGIGANLATLGASRGREALQEAANAAGLEQRRNIANQQMEQQEKAGNRQLGATIGSAIGTAWGPVGTLVGGAIGSIAGGLFAAMLVLMSVVQLAIPTDAEASTMKPPITQMELHQLLAYDPETGVFTWLDPAANGMVKAGDRAGCEKKSKKANYRCIKISGRPYAEHRLAWLYMVGEWPESEIDHKNRDKKDNRFNNLRPATRKQNCENRDARAGCLSGFRGVSWVGGKWVAQITHFGVHKHLGGFDDLELAKAARLKAEQEMFTHSNRTP